MFNQIPQSFKSQSESASRVNFAKETQIIRRSPIIDSTTSPNHSQAYDSNLSTRSHRKDIGESQPRRRSPSPYPFKEILELEASASPITACALPQAITHDDHASSPHITAVGRSMTRGQSCEPRDKFSGQGLTENFQVLQKQNQSFLKGHQTIKPQLVTISAPAMLPSAFQSAPYNALSAFPNKSNTPVDSTGILPRFQHRKKFQLTDFVDQQINSSTTIDRQKNLSFPRFKDFSESFSQLGESLPPSHADSVNNQVEMTQSSKEFPAIKKTDKLNLIKNGFKKNFAEDDQITSIPGFNEPFSVTDGQFAKSGDRDEKKHTMFDFRKLKPVLNVSLTFKENTSFHPSVNFFHQSREQVSLETQEDPDSSDQDDFQLIKNKHGPTAEPLPFVLTTLGRSSLLASAVPLPNSLQGIFSKLSKQQEVSCKIIAEQILNYESSNTTLLLQASQLLFHHLVVSEEAQYSSALPDYSGQDQRILLVPDLSSDSTFQKFFAAHALNYVKGHNYSAMCISTLGQAVLTHWEVFASWLETRMKTWSKKHYSQVNQTLLQQSHSDQELPEAFAWFFTELKDNPQGLLLRNSQLPLYYSQQESKYIELIQEYIPHSYKRQDLSWVPAKSWCSPIYLNLFTSLCDSVQMLFLSQKTKVFFELDFQEKVQLFKDVRHLFCTKLFQLNQQKEFPKMEIRVKRLNNVDQWFSHQSFSFLLRMFEDLKVQNSLTKIFQQEVTYLLLQRQSSKVFSQKELLKFFDQKSFRLEDSNQGLMSKLLDSVKCFTWFRKTQCENPVKSITKVQFDLSKNSNFSYCKVDTEFYNKDDFPVQTSIAHAELQFLDQLRQGKQIPLHDLFPLTKSFYQMLQALSGLQIEPEYVEENSRENSFLDNLIIEVDEPQNSQSVDSLPKEPTSDTQQQSAKFTKEQKDTQDDLEVFDSVALKYFNIDQLSSLNKDKRVNWNLEPLKENFIRTLDWNFIENEVLPFTLGEDFTRMQKWCQQKCVSIDFSHFPAQQLDYTNKANFAYSEVPIELSIQRAIASQWAKKLSKAEAENIKIICPLFVVPKPNLEPRLIYDARQANWYIQDKVYQLPALQDPLLVGFNFVCKVDLKHSFMHLPIDEKMQQVSGFRDQLGQLYAWTKLIWGLSPAPYIMQKFSEVFAAKINKTSEATVLVYTDDFLILAKTYQVAHQACQSLLRDLQLAGVEINWEKSQIVPKKSAQWLGHYVHQNRIEPDPKRQLATKILHKQVQEKPTVASLLTFLAKLSYQATIAVGAKPIVANCLASIPNVLVKMQKRQKHRVICQLSEKFRKALRLATKLVTQPGICYQLIKHKVTLEVATDASGFSGGISSLDGKFRFTVPFKGKIWNQLQMSLQDEIYKKELFVLLQAVKSAPQHVNLRVFMDNMTCIFGVLKSAQTDEKYANMLKFLHAMVARKDISLSLKFVQSKRNPADYPSRISCQVFKDQRFKPQDSQSQVYGKAHVPASRKELVDFNFREFNLNLPKETTSLWQLKLLKTKKQKAGFIEEAAKKALNEWREIDPEVKIALGIQIVDYVSKLTVSGLNDQMNQVVTLLTSEGLLRVNPLEQSRLEFNANAIELVRSEYSKPHFESPELDWKNKKPKIDLVKRVEINSKQDLFYDYVRKAMQDLQEQSVNKWTCNLQKAKLIKPQNKQHGVPLLPDELDFYLGVGTETCDGVQQASPQQANVSSVCDESQTSSQQNHDRHSVQLNLNQGSLKL